MDLLVVAVESVHELAVRERELHERSIPGGNVMLLLGLTNRQGLPQ